MHEKYNRVWLFVLCILGEVEGASSGSVIIDKGEGVRLKYANHKAGGTDVRNISYNSVIS